MSTQTLTLKYDEAGIEFSDIDEANEVEILATNNFDNTTVIYYANKEDLISLKKHLDYLVSKF